MPDEIKISELSSIDTLLLSSVYFVALDQTNTTQSSSGSTMTVLGHDIALAFWSMSADYIPDTDLTYISSLSAGWQNTYTNFSTQSARNASVYTSVNTNSAVTWNYQGNDVKSVSSNWQNTYTNFSTQSARNASVYTSVNTNSATWSGGGTISNPRIYYVATNGNDGTGQVGNPAKPFQTVSAAYTAGVSAVVNFILQLGYGSFTWELAEDVSGFMDGIYGVSRGTGLYGTAGTALYITNNHTASVSNANGANGYSLSLTIGNLALSLINNGQPVFVDDSYSYIGGNGGNITIYGSNVRLMSYINANGGSGEMSSTSGGVTGGNGGNIRLSGIYSHEEAGEISALGGTLYGSGSNGSDGNIYIDDCDVRTVTIPSNNSVSMGRSSYYSTLITIDTDYGGNANYI